MNEQKLQNILETGNVKECVAFFKGMPEKQRRALAPLCLSWLRKIKKNLVVESPGGVFKLNPLMGPAEAAVLATATLAELSKLGRFVRPDDETAFALLVDRRSQWVHQWVLSLLSESHYWRQWKLIRRLMAAGLAMKPNHPNYYLGMISGFADAGNEYGRAARCIETFLLSEPDLLDDDLWRLFEHEGGGENSLANWDRFTRGQTWCDALVALMKAGRLPRERLVNCSLDGLERDFNHYRAKWFAAFHDALALSVQEQQQHAVRYLGLLDVSAPNIVSWAIQKVEKLSKCNVYEPAALIAAMTPVLEARSKATVKTALKLLGRTAKQADDRLQAAGVAVAALGHEAADVQQAALDTIELLGTSGDGELVIRLAQYRELVAPSLRGRLSRWLKSGRNDHSLTDPPQRGHPPGANTRRGKAAPSSCSAPGTGRPKSNGSPSSACLSQRLDKLDPKLRSLFAIDRILENINAGRIGIPAATFDGTDIPRLDPRQRLSRIEDLDELIDVCARVIEDGSSVDDAERAFDGLSRLCHHKPGDFERRTAALLKRATQRVTRGGAAGDLCHLVHAWCTGTVFEAADDFLSQRSLEIARRLAAGTPAPLLSAPTHAGGWIDPCVLAQRAGTYQGHKPDTRDVCLAMLRLAPEGRAKARRRMPNVSAEWGWAIQYALGAQGVQIGLTPALWIAAARSRAPWSDDPRVEKKFPKRGPDAGQAAKYAFPCTACRGRTDLSGKPALAAARRPDSDCPTIALHALEALLFDRSASSIRWLATLWPQARESFFAAAAHQITINLDWWEAMWHNKALLEPLLEPGTPLRTMGLLLLAVALAAKEPGEQGLATDAAISAIEDGRLGCDNLGFRLAELLPTGLIKPGRWYKALAEVARVSPVHALVVQRSLMQCLHGDPERMPRDYGKLLELLKELSIDLRQWIEDEGCRAFLNRIKGSGKAAKTAQELLALEPDRKAEAGKGLMLQALQQRLAAAERLSDR